MAKMNWDRVRRESRVGRTNYGFKLSYPTPCVSCLTTMPAGTKAMALRTGSRTRYVHANGCPVG
jgi:hypothetical protein